MLDPLPRWVSADVLATGDLVIGGRTVPGEGARARRVQELLLRGADAHQLAAAGVGWVVVEGTAPTLPLPITYRDNDIALYRIGGTTPAASGRGLLIAAHLVWLGMVIGGLGAMAWRRRGARLSQSP